MKLTKAQRAKVVLLLRCAADLSITGNCWTDAALCNADELLGFFGHEFPFWDALAAERETGIARPWGLLEAAQLVEEGVLP